MLVLAPELYLPIRNLAAQYHAGADGLAVSGRLLDLIDDAGRGAPGHAPCPQPARRPGGHREGKRRLPGPAVAGPRPLQPGAGCGRDGRPGRSERRRKEHRRVAAAAVRRPIRRASVRGRRRPRGLRRRGLARAAWRGCRRVRRCSAARSPPISLWVRPVPPTTPSATRRSGRAPTPSSARCPTATTTLVGEAGRALSAGERQRIALARAFLRDAALVILDEPTANLDAASAERVAEAIGGLDSTVLVITHDPRLASLADRVSAARLPPAPSCRWGRRDAPAARAGRHAPWPRGTGRVAGRGDRAVRRRADDDVGLPDFPRSPASAGARADRRHRRRAVLRPGPPDRALPGAPGVARPRAALAGARPRGRVRTDRAAGAGRARGIPPR